MVKKITTHINSKLLVSFMAISFILTHVFTPDWQRDVRRITFEFVEAKQKKTIRALTLIELNLFSRYLAEWVEKRE